MGHREVQYRGLCDIERCNIGTMGHREVQYRGLWDIERYNIGDYGTKRGTI